MKAEIILLPQISLYLNGTTFLLASYIKKKHQERLVSLSSPPKLQEKDYIFKSQRFRKQVSKVKIQSQNLHIKMFSVILKKYCIQLTLHKSRGATIQLK